jgi:hypothetical protein
VYRQVTVLRNYYATSDPDEFCFDKHKDSDEHYEEWVKEYLAQLDNGDEDIRCRVYPNDLLPQEHHNQQGHWRITVEFIPTGKED